MSVMQESGLPGRDSDPATGGSLSGSPRGSRPRWRALWRA